MFLFIFSFPIFRKDFGNIFSETLALPLGVNNDFILCLLLLSQEARVHLLLEY